MHESTGSALSLDLLPDQRRPRLLVVDDQPTNIELLYRLFADEYQVFMATNGPQALAKVEAEPPDLILLDWVMPDMNGLAVCEALKSNPDTRDIPVLFVTASHAPEEETRALEVGGVDFITKPINPAAVKARVKTHLTLKLQTDLLKRMAFLDGLTGIFNRRYFDDRLSTEMARAARDGRQLGLVLIDVPC
jgi:PleD family two-component response regulator